MTNRTRAEFPVVVFVLAVLLPACSLSSSDGIEQLWRTESASSAFLGSQGSTDGERFYAASGRALAAFRASDGEMVWRTALAPFCEPPPVAAGRVFCPAEVLTALDAATGGVQWRAEPGPVRTFAQTKATADARRVYAGEIDADGRIALGRTRSVVRAYDAATGVTAWERTLEGEEWLGTWVRSLTLSGDTLFVTADAYYSENGFLSASAILALDAATGRELWRFQDGDGTKSQKIGGLAVAGDVLVYSDPEGIQSIVGVSRTTRRILWRVPRQPGFLGTLQAPAVADGVAYIAEGDERLYAIRVATGEVVWDVKPDRGSYRNHVVCGPYLVGDNTALTVVDRATGALDSVLLKGGGDRTVLQMASDGRRLFAATKAAVYAFACE